MIQPYTFSLSTFILLITPSLGFGSQNCGLMALIFDPKSTPTHFIEYPEDTNLGTDDPKRISLGY